MDRGVEVVHHLRADGGLGEDELQRSLRIAGIAIDHGDERPVWRLKDLNWARLTIWREALAQVFEQESWIALIPQIDGITIAHSGAKATTDCFYVAAWLAARLPSAKVTFMNAADTVDQGLQGITISAGVRQASVTASGPDWLTVEIDGMHHQVLMPPRQDHTLLHEELSILGKDCNFEQSLAGSAVFSK